MQYTEYNNVDCSPSGSFLLLTAAGLDFLLLTVDPRLLIPLMMDMVSSSPPTCREFRYEMRGSQQSSRCRAIWNVMNRSRYMWLWKCQIDNSQSGFSSHSMLSENTTCSHLVAQTHTVLLSCRMSLLENSLRMSKKAKLSGGPPSPWGLGSLKANSIPSLKQTDAEGCNEHKDLFIKNTNVIVRKSGYLLM